LTKKIQKMRPAMAMAPMGPTTAPAIHALLLLEGAGVEVGDNEGVVVGVVVGVAMDVGVDSWDVVVVAG
jgi:hypothetical protein